jgi:hypothetical protein
VYAARHHVQCDCRERGHDGEGGVDPDEDAEPQQHTGDRSEEPELVGIGPHQRQ